MPETSINLQESFKSDRCIANQFWASFQLYRKATHFFFQVPFAFKSSFFTDWILLFLITNLVLSFQFCQVSWIRKHDYHLLTVGVTTYNTDDRFMVEHVRHLQNWGLMIKHVQPSDAGLYECQVSTHPPTSIIVELKVTSKF